MPWEAWFTLAVAGLVLVALVRNYATDVVVVGAVSLLCLVQGFTGSSRLPSAKEAFSAYGNEALVTVGVLFIVACGLVHTGALSLISAPLLGRPKNVVQAQSRLMFPVASLSAFLNNTPIVAMFIPVVSDWCKQNTLSPSKLFIPLSFATVLGGVITIIGTSTNLVVNGLWIQSGHPSFSLFDITPLGLPVAIAGIIYLMVAGRWLLPERKKAFSLGDDPREYTVEMLVEPGSPIVGQTIEEAGLRHLHGMYLMEIDRAGEVIAAVGAGQKLQAHDHLVFVGVVDSVVDLQKMRGLTPAASRLFNLDVPRLDRVMVEAVVSNSCPIVGSTIRDGKFRSRYNAAVVAVARNGVRLKQKIGDVVLEPGDTLLLETRSSFAEQQRNSRDFFLVSRVDGATPTRHDKAVIALVTLVGMVVCAGFEWLSMLNSALLAAGVMLLTRCCTPAEARRAVDWQVLATIGASFGLGLALEKSGAASAIASVFIQAAGNDPWMTLVVVYVLALVLTELLSNNAAAAIAFPIALVSAQQLGVNPVPFMMVLMVAASCGFATPLGYQTHLMVYGPGGYRFTDYLRIGIPLDILCGVIAVILAPMIWPFH
ncbi:MAG: SLC13 family permease [Burkholderiales bacterium]